MPDEKKSDDLAANLQKLDEAAKLPDDSVEIAADDQGASALAQKVDRLGER
jgi:hypothetical protein